MGNCVIRAATEADVTLLVDGLVAMLQAMETYGAHPFVDSEVLRKDFHERIRDNLTQPHMRYLVAEWDGQAVGILEASHINLESVFRPREVLHIHGVYVAEAYRRWGIARQLMEQVMQWGRENRCTLVELHVLPNNPAQDLYRSLGFTLYEYQMIRDL